MVQSPKELVKRLEDLEKGGRVETIQTTSSMRSARELKRLAVTQVPLEDHQLTLMWKNSLGVK